MNLALSDPTAGSGPRQWDCQRASAEFFLRVHRALSLFAHKTALSDRVRQKPTSTLRLGGHLGTAGVSSAAPPAPPGGEGVPATPPPPRSPSAGFPPPSVRSPQAPGAPSAPAPSPQRSSWGAPPQPAPASFGSGGPCSPRPPAQTCRPSLRTSPGLGRGGPAAGARVSLCERVSVHERVSVPGAGGEPAPGSRRDKRPARFRKDR